LGYKSKIENFKIELEQSLNKHRKIQKSMIGDDGEISKQQD